MQERGSIGIGQRERNGLGCEFAAHASLGTQCIETRSKCFAPRGGQRLQSWGFAQRIAAESYR